MAPCIGIFGDLVRLRLPVLVAPRAAANRFARSLGLSNLAAGGRGMEVLAGGGSNVRTGDLVVITPLARMRTKTLFLPASRASGGLDARHARIANQLPPLAERKGGYA